MKAKNFFAVMMLWLSAHVGLVQGHSTTQTLRVEALIDGESQLIIRGNTAQWHHLYHAAPGRLDFRNEPTLFNGVAWYPIWPDIPDEENRYCNCFSDVFFGVDPALQSKQDESVVLHVIRARESVSIVQQPSAANNFTLVLDFNDEVSGGADNYIIELETQSSTDNSVFGAFTPRAEFTLGPKANDDSYWVRAWLKLAKTSNGIDPLTEAVTIKVGPFSHTLPVGSFTQDGNSYLFKGPVGPSTLDVRITPSSTPGGYSFKSCLKNGDLEATTMEPQMQLTIGDDQGTTTLDVGYAKFGKGSDGRKWVFPNPRPSR